MVRLGDQLIHIYIQGQRTNTWWSGTQEHGNVHSEATPPNWTSAQFLYVFILLANGKLIGMASNVFVVITTEIWL